MAIIIQQREPALRCSLHELINSLGMHSFHSKNSAVRKTSPLGWALHMYVNVTYIQCIYTKKHGIWLKSKKYEDLYKTSRYSVNQIFVQSYSVYVLNFLQVHGSTYIVDRRINFWKLYLSIKTCSNSLETTIYYAETSMEGPRKLDF